MSNHFFSSDSIDQAEQDAELLATKAGASSSVLLRDDRHGSRTPKSVEPSLRALQLPMVPVSLFPNGSDSLSLLAVEVSVEVAGEVETEVEGGGEGRLELSEPDADSAILETVLGAVGERLLMFTRPGCRVRFRSTTMG